MVNPKIKKPTIDEAFLASLQEELQEVRKATLRACRKMEGLPQASKRKKAR